MLSPLNPHPYIYKSSYDFNFQTVKNKVQDYIRHADEKIQKENINTHEKDGAVTTVVLCKEDPPHNWEEFKSFREDWLYGKIDELWSMWRMIPMRRQLDSSWLNVHPTGGYTEEHHHQNVQIAVSCYLDVPEGSGRFMVKNPLQVYKMNEPLVYDYYPNQYEWDYIDVKTNDVLFFPGWLTHKTEVNKVENDRYIMSLNVVGVHEYAS